MLAGQGGDLLIPYLSGAGADGGSQADPDAALGGYRSSSRACGLGVLVAGTLAGIRIDHASPGNGPGVGLLEVAGDDAVRWTPPDDAAGTAVAIANGQQRQLAGADPAKFLLVTRSSSDTLAGGAAVTLTHSYNDLLGGTDVDLSTDDGLPRHRLLVLKNAGGGLVRGLRVWLGTSAGTVAIAREDPSSQPAGNWQTIANERTAPSGLTWVAPTSSGHADTIVVDLLPPGHMVGIWIRRSHTGPATPRAAFGLAWSFSALA